MSNPITSLPATVVPVESLTTKVAEPKEGQLVVIPSRGRMRVARVTKVGPKRVTAEYTTPGAINEAMRIAEISQVATLTNQSAYAQENVRRYERKAALIEELGIEVTEDKADSFVSLDSLPAEYVELESISNYDRTTIVWSPAQNREWAERQRQVILSIEAKLDEAKAYDALPFAERAARHVHMTTKSVSRDEVWEVPA